MICSCPLVTDSEFCSHGTDLGPLGSSLFVLSFILVLGVLFYEASPGFTLGFHFDLHFEECSPSVGVNSEFIFWEPEALGRKF